MQLVRPSKAGTYESNDIYIMLFPGEKTNSVELDSNVYETFGKQITKVILDTLDEYKIQGVKVKAVDKGALDCTIKARVITAIHRGAENG